MTIRRYEVAAGNNRVKSGVTRSSPGGTGTVVVQVNIEQSLATDRNAVIATLEAIAKQIAQERWPMA